MERGLFDRLLPRILRWLQNFWNIFAAQLFKIVKLFLVTHLSALTKNCTSSVRFPGGVVVFLQIFFRVGLISHNEGENNHCHRAHRHT